MDYSEVSTSLLFTETVDRQCVNVTIVNDDILENIENFFANLTTIVSNILLEPDRAEIQIREDPTDGMSLVLFTYVMWERY